ncbi:MAG: hypothetical protein QNJ71_11315, partial [Acidimicrobiia bacterium]|nr:hypothetical protein [Acidimicrobiia bacterium]
MRYLRGAVLLTVSILIVLSGLASAQTGDEPIVVIEVGDPLDARIIDYVTESIREEPAHAYVLKIDSPGVSSGDLSALFETIASAPAPVIAWIGPSPAVAYGGAAFLANQADIRSAAPDAVVGYLDPSVHVGERLPPSVRPDPLTEEAFQGTVDRLAADTVTVGVSTASDPVLVPGFVDQLDPALGQLLIGLDGREVVRGDMRFELDTARTEVVEGEEVLLQSRPVKFTETGLLDRFLRLGARPETAFLFLLFGLAFA